MNRRFALHYLEMVVVMFVGMQVLGLLVSLVANIDSTAPMLVEMGAAMTVSMVAWMLFRGHVWPRCLEMAMSMILPTLGTLVVYGVGVVDDEGSLMVLLHALMLPAMLVAMLLRRDDYGHHEHTPAEVTA